MCRATQTLLTSLSPARPTRGVRGVHRRPRLHPPHVSRHPEAHLSCVVRARGRARRAWAFGLGQPLRASKIFGSIIRTSLCSTPPLGARIWIRPFQKSKVQPPPPRGSLGLPESPKVQAPPSEGSFGLWTLGKVKVQHPPRHTPRCEVKSTVSVLSPTGLA